MTSELSQARTNLAGQLLENPMLDHLGVQPAEWEVGRCTFELTIGSRHRSSAVEQVTRSGRRPYYATGELLGANGRLRATAQDTFRHAQAGEVGPDGRTVWRCNANPQQFTGR
jgi:hypothetical protein